MSMYRNDHEAAVARIEALEHELTVVAKAKAGLERENAKLRAHRAASAPMLKASPTSTSPLPYLSLKEHAVIGLLGAAMLSAAILVLLA
jgi:hypothetical protein